MASQFLIFLLIIILLLSICLIIINSINLTNVKISGGVNNILIKYGGDMDKVKEAVDRLIDAYIQTNLQKSTIEQQKNDLSKNLKEKEFEILKLERALKNAKINPITQKIEVQGPKRILEYGTKDSTNEHADEYDNISDELITDKNAEIDKIHGEMDILNSKIKDKEIELATLAAEIESLKKEIGTLTTDRDNDDIIKKQIILNINEILKTDNT